VELHRPRPIGYGEKIRIRHREGIAEEIRSALELLLDDGIAFAQICMPLGTRFGGGLLPEEGRVSLVELRVDEAEHLLQVIARQRARGRRKTRFGLQIRKVLDDDGTLGQYLPVIQFERRNITLGVDGEVIPFRSDGLGLEVHLLQAQLEASLEGDDVGRQRAGAARIKQFHAGLLWSMQRSHRPEITTGTYLGIAYYFR